jgi:hypothetical protein
VFRGAIASAMKLELFKKKHLENSNVFKFSSFDFIHKNGPANIPFASMLAICIVDLLVENFKIRYNEYYVNATHTRSSVILFAVEV